MTTWNFSKLQEDLIIQWTISINNTFWITRTDGPNFVKKTTKGQEKPVQFSELKYCQIEYLSSIKGFVICSEFIDRLVKSRFCLEKRVIENTICNLTEQTYSIKVPINIKKMGDTRIFFAYIPDDKKGILWGNFYLVHDGSKY